MPDEGVGGEHESVWTTPGLLTPRRFGRRGGLALMQLHGHAALAARAARRVEIHVVA